MYVSIYVCIYVCAHVELYTVDMGRGMLEAGRQAGRTTNIRTNAYHCTPRESLPGLSTAEVAGFRV